METKSAPLYLRTSWRYTNYYYYYFYALVLHSQGLKISKRKMYVRNG